MSAPKTTASKTTAFVRYAPWYAAFNRDKDYAAEAHYVLEKIKPWQPAPEHWLDVGCGTGEHASFLALQGIHVEGVDASEAMIAQARTAHPTIPFHNARAQEFHLRDDYDVISMLFHVVSYQISDNAIAQVLGNVAAHLAPGGVLVFDFWHSEGVLFDPPGERVRKANVGDRQLFRIARPTMDCDRHRVDIHYEFRWNDREGHVAFEETHSMRYFGRDELMAFLRDAGLRVVACEGWLTDRALHSNDWYGVMCAQKPEDE